MTPTEARAWISSAASVAVLTGAGISAESGIPTFRGSGGLWRKYKAENLATPEAFARDPQLIWEWYDWRRELIAQASPNPGHHALAKLEQLIGSHSNVAHASACSAGTRAGVPREPDTFTLITQNVDALHDRAGSQRILKLHGDIWTLRCTACARTWTDPRAPLPVLPPKCECGAMARPGVVWFGDSLPDEVWASALAAARQAEVFLVVGTSSVVYPAAGLVHIAKQSGAKVIEINIAETPVSALVDFSWRAPAAVALPQLL